MIFPQPFRVFIDAAVAAFDADRESSRRYLLRASALLRVKRAARTAAESVRRSESRGGLLAWQLNRVVDYIETHLAGRLRANNASAVHTIHNRQYKPGLRSEAQCLELVYVS
jgi:hypothetical protein